MMEFKNGPYVVTGVREFNRLLRQFEPETVRRTQRDIRKAGDPIISHAVRIVNSSLRYGDRPMRNWGRGGRLGWNTAAVVRGFKIGAGGRYVKQTHTWPVMEFRQTNPAGALFDWAGRNGEYVDARGRTGRGVAFINNLPRLGSLKGSRYSRSVFPAIVAGRPAVVSEFQRVIGTVVADTNRKLENI